MVREGTERHSNIDMMNWWSTDSIGDIDKGGGNVATIAVLLIELLTTFIDDPFSGVDATNCQFECD